MDELDTQLANELAEKSAQSQELTEQTKTAESTEPKTEPKTYDEEYVKGLRAENARRRIEFRNLQESIPSMVQEEVQRILNPQYQNPYSMPYGQIPGQQYEYRDPRVDELIKEQDDIRLANKINEMKADPYLGELFNEVDEYGDTFAVKIFEEAKRTGYPIDEFDALVWKMEHEKIVGRAKQKGIDEAYKSMSTKAAGSAEKGVSSGKSVEEGEIKNVDDAVKKAMKEHGVTSLSELR
jgi:hypothetical protein